MRFQLLTALGLAAIASILTSDSASANPWPPPPGANMSDPNNWPNDPGYTGQWNFWSFLPKQMTGAPAYTSADMMLGASGMHVDEAWTYTIGRPDVRIAVLDSGIEWEQADLLRKAYLNAAELAGTKRPQDKTGTVCGGAGALAGYDCDGDGVFTVSDYAADPRVTPTVTGDKCFTDGDRTQMGPDRIKGDVNHNCVLDAGDLILMFSDGTDDDANGYTDDISGWDFYKNDNDPYDDTRYGHGTGEAEDSSAEGNNMIGSLGVCPMCRVVPLRCGESYLCDGADWAKAAIYAADNGIKVINQGGVTVNGPAFAQAAIDYAYGKGLVISSSQGDENARHHHTPGTTNHTLPVHATMYNGSGFDNSSSFIAFNRCSNYGGQTALAIPGHSCASEAAGRTSGLAGMVFSMALSRTQPLDLSAEEVMQVLKTTADDIYVPGSGSDDPNMPSPFYESKPGFDQRFGYGRPNLGRAMKMVSDGTIPPEVDITAPVWFDTLYDTAGPVAITGRIAATRATSYDYKVEWAPGVEPDDADFKPLMAPVTNVPASTVTGGTMPIAVLDPVQIDTSHTADPDSPMHENDRTITIRIHATAHYGNTTVDGEARRNVAVVNMKNGGDADLLPGFPIRFGASAESSPKLADIDGDGIRDIVEVTTDGKVHAITVAHGMPTEIAGFPYLTTLADGLDASSTDPSVPSYINAPAYKNAAQGGIDPSLGRETTMATPGIADLNGDGRPEIVFGTYHGTIHVVDATGKALPGWPKKMPQVPSCSLDPSKPTPQPCMDAQHHLDRGTLSGAVLVDMTNDGKPEIVMSWFDGQIHAFKLDGTEVPGFPVPLHVKGSTYDRIISTPSAADLNGDGIPELVSGSNETAGGGGGAGPVHVIDGRGTNAPGGPEMPHWPQIITSLDLLPLVGIGVGESPAFADFDLDGKPDVVFAGTGTFYVTQADPGQQAGPGSDPPNLLPVVTADGGTTTGFAPTAIFGDETKATRPDTFLTAISSPAVGDVDQDGVPDLLVCGDSLKYAAAIMAGAGDRFPFQHLLAMYSGKTGQMFPAAPMVTEDITFFVNPIVADVSGDDYPEVLMGTGSYFLHAFDACGDEPKGWPKFTDGWMVFSPAVGDLDGDHKLEVVTATREGHLYAWHTAGKDDGAIDWESFHHDNANTGNYGTKLDQGVVRKATAPLDCHPAPPPPMETVSPAGGGCSCDTAGREASRAALFAALAALGVLVFRRRRRSV